MPWLLQDVQFGLRAISKDRSFFFTSVLALALGIGATTVIFSVIDNVLLNPFPYVNSQRIYDIYIQDPSARASFPRNWFSVPEFLDIEEQNRFFDRPIGVWEKSTMLGDPASPEALDTDVVTGNAFQFLGVPPLLGRGIQPADAQPGAPPVFVLSYKVWNKRFGLDPSVLGKTFLLNNTPTTLIGIMPRRFTWWGGDIWMPAVLDRARPGTDRYVLYGHLKPGLSRKAAVAYAARTCSRRSLCRYCCRVSPARRSAHRFRYRRHHSRLHLERHVRTVEQPFLRNRGTAPDRGPCSNSCRGEPSASSCRD